MRKYKTLNIGISIIMVLMIITIFHFKENNTDVNWIDDLSYDQNQVYNISFALFNDCPTIPVEISHKEVNLLFDTGNGMGTVITSALENKIDYEVIGTTIELNADGTKRGEGKSILLKQITIFGEDYFDVRSSLTDWRMFGFFKINGTLGLKYFRNKVVTVDYKNKKIAVSMKAIDYSKLQKEKYIVIPLIKSSLVNEEDLLFFEGEVNGEKCTIYLDTGSNRSFYNIENVGAEIVMKLGDKILELKSSKFRHEDIGFQDEFRYPLKLAINSDILRNYNFVITIDKIQNNLIISQIN